MACGKKLGKGDVLTVDEQGNKLVVGAEKKRSYAEVEIEFKQINSMKFINYSLRILNVYGYPDVRKTCFYYYALASTGKMANFIVNCSRVILALKIRLNKKSIESIKMIQHSLHLFFDLFHSYDEKKIYELSKNRGEFKNQFFAIYKKLPKDDVFVIGSLAQMIEIILDLTEVRMGLEH